MTWLLQRFLARPEVIHVEYDHHRQTIRVRGTLWLLEWTDWHALIDWLKLDPAEPPVHIHVI